MTKTRMSESENSLVIPKSNMNFITKTYENSGKKKRAKILTNALTSIDEYAQTKAEDIDSVSQTLLYIAVGTLGTIGTFIGKKLASFSKSAKIPKR